MEKKKLGLSNKKKLELSKTVGGGTVKQSFSHGRVKSVAVEVKKVRTFKKNENENNKLYKEESPENFDKNKTNSLSEDLKDNDKKLNTSEIETKEDRLKKIKEAAHTDRLERENNHSINQEEKFENIKSERNNKTAEIKQTLDASNQNKNHKNNVSQNVSLREKQEEEKVKKSAVKKK